MDQDDYLGMLKMFLFWRVCQADVKVVDFAVDWGTEPSLSAGSVKAWEERTKKYILQAANRGVDGR